MSVDDLLGGGFMDNTDDEDDEGDEDRVCPPRVLETTLFIACHSRIWTTTNLTTEKRMISQTMHHSHLWTT